MQKTSGSLGMTEAERLNQHCTCITLDRRAATQSLIDQLGDDADEAFIRSTWHQLFSNVAVFVPSQVLEQMRATVQAIENAAVLPDYQRQVLSWAPQSAQLNPGPVGVFMGYDFHLGEDGPRLIEINTNAGGAFLNAILVRAQLQCCGDAKSAAGSADFEAKVIAQFESEWRAQRGNLGYRIR